MHKNKFDLQFFGEGEDGGSAGDVGAGVDTAAVAGNEENKPDAKAGEPESLLTTAGKAKSDTKEGEQKTGEDTDSAGKDTKPEDDKEGKEDVPALTSEDLVIPEGKEYDPELGKTFLDVINDTSIPRKDLAQTLLNMYATEQDKLLQGLQAADAAGAEQLKQIEAEWAKSCKADAEYGGQKWEGSQAVIAAGRDKLASPEAVEIIEAYGFGSHPEILRMFYRAGKMLSEDNMSGGAGGSGKKADPAEAIFGESLKGYKKGDSE